MEHSYCQKEFIKWNTPSRNPASVAVACLLDCLSTWEVVPSSNTLHSSFLSWFSGRMELSSSVCHGLSLKNIFLPSTRVFSLTQGSPPFQKLDFGLCARVFSAVLLPLEPTIDFSDCSAVSPSKSRDFRLYEPTILFSNWSAVSHPKTRDFRFP